MSNCSISKCHLKGCQKSYILSKGLKKISIIFTIIYTHIKVTDKNTIPKSKRNYNTIKSKKSSSNVTLSKMCLLHFVKSKLCFYCTTQLVLLSTITSVLIINTELHYYVILESFTQKRTSIFRMII